MMKRKSISEFDNFCSTMDKLLAIPYSELKKKLDEEKELKKQKKERRSISDGARVSEKGS